MTHHARLENVLYSHFPALLIIIKDRPTVPMCAKVRSVVTIYLPIDKDHVTS